MVFRASWSSCHPRLSLPTGSRGAPVGIPGRGSEEAPWPRPSLLLGVLSGRACQAELSARVRRDEFLREAPLCPGLPAAGKEGGVLAVGQADEGGMPPRPGLATCLCACHVDASPVPSRSTPTSSQSFPGGLGCRQCPRCHSPAGRALAHSALGTGPYWPAALCFTSGQRTR